MKIIGIIAEYNPFHNGHAYQISRIREETDADFIVAAMSGDFVQRGEPAIMDKYARTRMALQGGADLVIELPVLWATSSAEDFAMAGVTLFEKMGCVDGLCFGAETDNLSLLSAIAAFLADEPTDYRRLLTSHLKKGMSFPAARAKALCDTFRSAALPDANSLSAILSSPNNILAIEYLKALKRLHSSIEPILLKRIGAGYHEETLLPAQNPASAETPALPTASASGIRALLLRSALPTDTLLPEALRSALPADTLLPEALRSALPADALLPEALRSALPAYALHILEEYTASAPLICAEDFSPLLGYQLLTQDRAHISHIGGISPDLANRLYNNRFQFCSFTQFCEQNKSREVTYTRISRILLHLILQITENSLALGCSLDYIPYLRILGFRQNSRLLLSVLKKSAAIPMLKRLAADSALLTPEAEEFLQKDIFAADLYEQTKAIKGRTGFRSEYSRKLVRL